MWVQRFGSNSVRVVKDTTATGGTDKIFLRIDNYPEGDSDVVNKKYVSEVLQSIQSQIQTLNNYPNTFYVLSSEYYSAIKKDYSNSSPAGESDFFDDDSDNIISVQITNDTTTTTTNYYTTIQAAIDEAAKTYITDYGQENTFDSSTILTYKSRLSRIILFSGHHVVSGTINIPNYYVDSDGSLGNSVPFDIQIMGSTTTNETIVNFSSDYPNNTSYHTWYDGFRSCGFNSIDSSNNYLITYNTTYGISSGDRVNSLLFKDLTIKGSRWGIYAESKYLSVERCTFINCGWTGEIPTDTAGDWNNAYNTGTDTSPGPITSITATASGVSIDATTNLIQATGLTAYTDTGLSTPDGNGATFDVVIKRTYNISTATISTIGSNYTVGDIIKVDYNDLGLLNDTNTYFVNFRITSVDTNGAVTGIELIEDIKNNSDYIDIYPSTLTITGISTVNVTNTDVTGLVIDIVLVANHETNVFVNDPGSGYSEGNTLYLLNSVIHSNLTVDNNYIQITIDSINAYSKDNPEDVTSNSVDLTSTSKTIVTGGGIFFNSELITKTSTYEIAGVDDEAILITNNSGETYDDYYINRKNNSIKNNNFYFNNEGIHCIHNKNLIISDNTFKKNLGKCITIKYCYKNNILSNFIESCLNNSIFLRNCFKCKIINNNIYDVWNSAITCVNSTHTFIQNNSLIDINERDYNAYGSTSTQQYGYENPYDLNSDAAIEILGNSRIYSNYWINTLESLTASGHLIHKDSKSFNNDLNLTSCVAYINNNTLVRCGKGINDYTIALLLGSDKINKSSSSTLSGPDLPVIINNLNSNTPIEFDEDEEKDIVNTTTSILIDVAGYDYTNYSNRYLIISNCLSYLYKYSVYDTGTDAEVTDGTYLSINDNNIQPNTITN